MGSLSHTTATRRIPDAEQAPPAGPSQVEMPVDLDKTLAEPDAPDDEYVVTAVRTTHKQYSCRV